MNEKSLIDRVELAIDEIRPYLIADGGDIKVVSIDNKNKIFIYLTKLIYFLLLIYTL